MEAATVICNSIMPSGASCGERAVVLKAHYLYDTRVYQGPGGYQHTLRETHYEIECPHCGRRTQIERTLAE
jgi:hypothetical protein